MFDIPFGNEDVEALCSPLPYLPLYLSGPGEYFVVLSTEDYVWASQWKWKAKPSKNGKKIYACRSGTFAGRSVCVYLHKEICFRSRGRPPTPSHIIADHCNGNSFDCRRKTYYGWQLRWATPSENRQNYHGIYAQQLRLAFLENSDRRLMRFQTRKYK